MAIAYDSSNSAVASGTYVDCTQTISGSDRIIFAYVGANSVTTTAVKIGTTNFTKIYEINSNGEYNSLRYLIAPPTGSQTITATTFSSTSVYISTASYTGVKQSGQPDAYKYGSVNGTSLTLTLTTIADNCWTIMGLNAQNAGASAGTGTTERQNLYGTNFLGDSNGPKTPAGSKSMTVNFNSRINGGIMASFAPVAQAGPANLKTINGLAKASVKTVNGLAIASVKTFNGLA